MRSGGQRLTPVLDLAPEHLRKLGALGFADRHLEVQALAVVGGLQHFATPVQPSHDLAGAVVEVEFDHRLGDGEAAVDEIKELRHSGAGNGGHQDRTGRPDGGLGGVEVVLGQ